YFSAAALSVAPSRPSSSSLSPLKNMRFRHGLLGSSDLLVVAGHARPFCGPQRLVRTVGLGVHDKMRALPLLALFVHNRGGSAARRSAIKCFLICSTGPRGLCGDPRIFDDLTKLPQVFGNPGGRPLANARLTSRIKDHATEPRP